jgi:hypothetical protein
MRVIKNFIGNCLIALAAFISFLRNALFFMITVGIVMGILMITLIAFFELVTRVSPPQEIPMALDLFGKWYWELIVFVLGALTMWQGIVKAFDDDKPKEKDLGKGWGNHNYNYGRK